MRMTKGELRVSGNIVIFLLASLTPQPARQRFRRLFKIPLESIMLSKNLESSVQQPNAESTIIMHKSPTLA